MKGAQIPEQNQESSMSEAKSKKQSHSAFSVTISKEDSRSNHGPLVQATISTLFKKVEKKVRPYNIITYGNLCYVDMVCLRTNKPPIREDFIFGSIGHMKKIATHVAL